MAHRWFPQGRSFERLIRRRSLPGLVWALSTFLYKRWIRWQDQGGHYRYADWIRTVEPGLLDQALLAADSPRNQRPRVCVLITATDLDQVAVMQTLGSLVSQPLDWRLALLLPETALCLRAGWLADLARTDDRVLLLNVPPEQFSPAQWAVFAEKLPCDWVMPVDAGTQMAPAWGALFGQAAQKIPLPEVVYWDEDRLDLSGKRCAPVFKPDWSPERQYSFNDLHNAAFRTDYLVHCSGRGKPGWELVAGAVARNVAHLPFVLSHCPVDMSEPAQVQAKSVRAYLATCGYGQVSVTCNKYGEIRAQWESAQPLVSIIIPTHDNLIYLQRCLDSLLSKTQYPHYEILIMDDHSSDPAVLAYYAKLLAAHERVALHHNPGSFNYSRVNNQGAHLARGELLLFLNNDVEICDADWLVDLVRWVLQPGVGVAGARLLYPNGQIQHAGIVVGMTGHANHVGAGDCPTRDDLVYSHGWYRNVSAVTGACMLVRRSVFERVGGFDEGLPLVFNDVELCQRVLQTGLRIVYTPAATLIHYEGRSRARYIPPEDLRRAAELLEAQVAQGDPYYSPNLSLAVPWPTYKRASEPSSIRRLRSVVRYLGNVRARR